MALNDYEFAIIISTNDMKTAYRLVCFRSFCVLMIVYQLHIKELL